MRRYSSYAGVTLLSLLLSGWGGVLAAAICPHMGEGRARVSTEAHSGCHTKIEESTPAHDGSQHAAGHGMKTMPAPGALGQERGVVAGQLSGTCGHCVGQGRIPPPPAAPRELNLKNRDAGAPAEIAVAPLFLVAPVFTQKFPATQNAPPGRMGRRLLLLNIFLI